MDTYIYTYRHNTHIHTYVSYTTHTHTHTTVNHNNMISVEVSSATSFNMHFGLTFLARRQNSVIKQVVLSLDCPALEMSSVTSFSPVLSKAAN